MNRRRDPSSCPPKVLKHGEEKSVLRPWVAHGEGNRATTQYVPAISSSAPHHAMGRVHPATRAGGSRGMYRARACSAVLQGRRELVTTGPAFEGQPRLLCSLQQKRHRARSNGRADSFTLKQTTPLLSRHISAAAAAAAVRGQSTNSAQQRLIESHPTTHSRARFSFQSLPFLSPG